MLAENIFKFEAIENFLIFVNKKKSINEVEV